MQQYKTIYHSANKIILILTLITFAFWIILLVLKKSRKYNEFFWGNIASFAVTFIYLTLLYSKAGFEYAGRIDCTFAILFWIFFVLINSFYLIVSNSRKARSFVPLFLILCFLVITNLNGEFAVRSVNYKTAKAVDDYIIQQIVIADENDLRSVEVKVPNHTNASNWPHPYNMAQWLQNTLYSHNIISRRIKIQIVPDNELTSRFHNDQKMEEFTDLESN